jgi:2-polyprenyl-3-methyl-5-hydroxy-6-metoxy-1,4-benzoquinol methylase
MADQDRDELREQVRSRYAQAARAVLAPRASTPPLARSTPQASTTAGCCGGAADSCCGGAAESCCGTQPAGGQSADRFGGPLSGAAETAGLPAEAVRASLGCGNPLTVAELHEGERVLDLGSGGGIDVLLSARRVGRSGFAYGVDMTDDMLELARANAVRAVAAQVGGGTLGAMLAVIIYPGRPAPAADGRLPHAATETEGAPA